MPNKSDLDHYQIKVRLHGSHVSIWFIQAESTLVIANISRRQHTVGGKLYLASVQLLK
jgi:hypothetical protein